MKQLTILFACVFFTLSADAQLKIFKKKNKKAETQDTVAVKEEPKEEKKGVIKKIFGKKDKEEGGAETGFPEGSLRFDAFREAYEPHKLPSYFGKHYL